MTVFGLCNLDLVANKFVLMVLRECLLCEFLESPA